MFVVTGGRQTGKTDAICRWLAENPPARCVIVVNHRRKEHLLQRLQDMYGRAMRNYRWQDHIYPAVEMQIGGYGRGGRAFHYPEVAIDDLQEVFGVLFGVQLGFATMNATWIPLGESTSSDTVKAEVVNDHMIEGVVADDVHFDGPRFLPAPRNTNL